MGTVRLTTELVPERTGCQEARSIEDSKIQTVPTGPAVPTMSPPALLDTSKLLKYTGWIVSPCATFARCAAGGSVYDSSSESGEIFPDWLRAAIIKYIVAPGDALMEAVVSFPRTRWFDKAPLWPP